MEFPFIKIATGPKGLIIKSPEIEYSDTISHIHMRSVIMPSGRRRKKIKNKMSIQQLLN